MVGCLVVAVQAEVAGPGLDDRAVVVERAVVVDLLLVRAGEIDRPVLVSVAAGAVDRAAGPLEHAAGEVEGDAADADGERAAAELDRAAARAGECSRVGDGLAAGEVERRSLGDVEGDAAGVSPALDVHGRPAPTLNVVPPENVPFGFRLKVIPWGNWGTSIVTPVPEVGSGAEDAAADRERRPAPLTVTLAAGRGEGGRRRQRERRPAADIDGGVVGLRQAGQAERSATDIERATQRADLAR